MNEIKYPIRNNHESLTDFIQLDAKEIIIKCGIARITISNETKNEKYV
jgi:hypothetical protein